MTYELTEEGRHYLKKGLPEVQLHEAAKVAGGTIPIQQIRSEPFFAIRNL